MPKRKPGPKTGYQGKGRTLYARVSPYTHFIVQQLAEQHHLSMSGVVRAALDEYVAKNKHKVEHSPTSP